jgi:hypothetical protein
VDCINTPEPNNSFWGPFNAHISARHDQSKF